MSSPTRSTLRWLYAQLPEWVAEGLIDDVQADKLRQRYGELPRSHTQTILVSIFAVLGAALLGGGLILILAHNWEDLNRSTRAALSFLPLLIAQGLSLYAWLRQPQSVAWIESTALFQALMVGSSIALVSQTYHISGDFRSFIQTWMLLTLPLAYLLRSTLVALLYLGLSTLWVGDFSYHPDNARLWFLLALMLPFFYQLYREHPANWRTVSFGYVFIIALLINSTNLLQNESAPWRLFYPLLFAVFYLFDAVAWDPNETKPGLRPFYLCGAGGIVIFTFVLSWSFYAERWTHSEINLSWLLHHDLPITVLTGLAIFLLIWARRHHRGFDPVTALFPVVAITAYWLPESSPYLINLYGLILGLGCIQRGLKQNRWMVCNAGVLLIAALILARFFDSDFGLLERGVVFIALGAFFLFINFLWWRKAQTTL